MAKSMENQANKMWGGHYAEGPAEAFAAINPSIGFDWELYRQDIAGSMAHARMLAEQGIISTADRDAILSGLTQVRKEIDAGQMLFTPALEDIHMHVESRLKELIGEAAGRLHTARSRNDQVATDMRLFLRDSCDAMVADITALQRALAARAAEHAESIMPGFTHWQPAQPVVLGHHLLAYVEMFARDAGRFADARARLNECPLGAAALAGTSYPINREMVAEELGFDRAMGNSLDAVASRDFGLEYLAAGAILATHLSRLAEELALWSSPLVGFVKLPESFTSGSSIMPQKRNPDAAELIRGKAGRVVGGLNALLMVVKAIPLAYNKDLQEDKEPLLDAARQLPLCLKAMRGMIEGMEPQLERMLAAAESGYATATDLADWLVQSLGMPFREAHHVTGRIVKLAEGRSCLLQELTLAEMQGVEPRITDAVFGRLSVQASVASRMSLGGTAPERVKAQAAKWQELLA